jgi:hypothetical protein
MNRKLKGIGPMADHMRTSPDLRRGGRLQPKEDHRLARQ